MLSENSLAIWVALEVEQSHVDVVSGHGWVGWSWGDLRGLF